MNYKFPKNFYWGSAFSGPQTEGAEKSHNKSPSIWTDCFDNNPEMFFEQNYVKNNFYENFKEDIRLAKSLNFNSLRTSIQWTRLIPDGKTVDPTAVKFYDNVFKEMIKNNIEPIINLYHFDTPLWAQKKGGWVSKEVCDLFVKYADTCFKLFNKYVTKWVTYNEPYVTCEMGYLEKHHPPFEYNLSKSQQVQWNMLITHQRVVKLFKENYEGEIGLILNITPAIPRSDSPEDIKASKIADLFQSRTFLDPIIKSVYPKEMLELANKYDFDWDRESSEFELIQDSKNNIDFLGINFYCPLRVKSPKIQDIKTALDRSYFYENYIKPDRRINPYRGWEIHPESLYNCLMNIKDNYKNVKLFVSENGMGVQNENNFLDDDKQMINDDYRIEFISEHLYWIYKAIQEGSNCFGYHMWTYIDNWSWLNSYKNRYGFISLDIETNKRTVKKSGYWFKKVAKNNELQFDINSIKI